VIAKFLFLSGNTERKSQNIWHRPTNISHSKMSRPGMGPIQPPIRRIPGFLPGGKAAGTWS
jgi:hypothetical protein